MNVRSLSQAICFSFFFSIVTGSSLLAKDQDDDHDIDWKEFLRVDCRYHNVEKFHGIDFCYASAIYKVKGKAFSHVQLGIGCDSQTVFNDKARIHEETLGERISPRTAAVPAIEIMPQGALTSTGTYESILDINKGRLSGHCYVHPVWEPSDLF